MYPMLSFLVLWLLQCKGWLILLLVSAPRVKFKIDLFELNLELNHLPLRPGDEF
jgi:hypothetical protein